MIRRVGWMLLLGWGSLGSQVLAQAQAPADAIVGTWLMPDGKRKLAIQPLPNGSFEGRIVWLHPEIATEADGSPRTDRKNPKPELRARPVLGLVVLTGLRYRQGKYEDGTMYSPDMGRSVSATATVVDRQTLSIRGTMFGMISKTFTLTRQP